jgi:hypothetical protein
MAMAEGIFSMWANVDGQDRWASVSRELGQVDNPQGREAVFAQARESLVLTGTSSEVADATTFKWYFHTSGAEGPGNIPEIIEFVGDREGAIL